MGNPMNYTTRPMADCRYGCRQESVRPCNFDSRQFPIGMAYVPWQKWKDIYEPAKALSVGTIFSELDQPFLGMRGVKR